MLARVRPGKTRERYLQATFNLLKAEKSLQIELASLMERDEERNGDSGREVEMEAPHQLCGLGCVGFFFYLFVLLFVNVKGENLRWD